MKRVAVSEESAGSQLPLLHIDQLPLALSYEKDGEVFYVARSRAKRWHYKAQLDLLDKQIEADSAKRNAVWEAYDFLEPLFRRHGENLTTAEVLALEAGRAA